MATTIKSSTLRVKIQESIMLDGSEQGTVTTKSISGINAVSKRLVTVTATEAVIATFSAAVASAGHYTAADVRYMRFTNKDDTNFITLTFRNQDNDEAAIKVDAGQSFIWNGDNVNGMTAVFNATQDADAASDTAFGSLTNIQADANTGSCVLEVFIASV
jgi:hypothetical protein|tara:strand:- start:1486 stop:1965 length:480 start_codon:yes stop_codon:yes gene_type:complete